MGGSVGKVISPVARVAADAVTLGGNELAGNPAGNLTNFNSGGPGAGSFFGRTFVGAGQTPPPQSIPGPFSLDPTQVAADQAAIKQLGTSQDAQNQQFIASDAESRAAARSQLADLLTQHAQQSFSQTLPQTAEDYNAGHLLNSTGYQQEVARQQSQLAAGISNQIGQQGVQDMYQQSAQKAEALKNLQGFGQAGLGRQLSLEDFINQANLAKSIGAQTAPQVGNGKGQTGALLSGVGSLAPLAGSIFGGMYGGPAGSAAGGAAGKYLGGTLQNKGTA